MTEYRNQHNEWLSLIEISGPFLAEPVLEQAFPQGLEKVPKKKEFRQTYEEWREAIDNQDPLQDKLHQVWINWVLKHGLEWDEDDAEEDLKTTSTILDGLTLELPEHGLTLKPDYALFGNDQDKPYLLVKAYPPETNLNDVLAGDGWSTSPAERMSSLCRATGIRLGLLTNGEQWMLVDAPEGGIISYGCWYARLWSQESVTLNAFFSLLNIRTVFSPFGLEDKKLPDLFEDSLKHQDEVTETLGEQVQRAVEVLIQSLDRINHDSNGKLLEGVSPTELYEAGLTFMMRLVFLLCAEERGLLLLGDETYEANYALSTLRMKLREEAGLHGEEVLSYRTNAWSRLLAIFRAVYGGVEHEGMRMPALGGSLFDPDRFPFLEGRPKDSKWRVDTAKPLPIDNRTVLLFLDAIQLFQGRTLSYRALDVEQIGYVYEGLLERTVVRSSDVSLEVDATKSAKTPWVLLGELSSAELDGSAAIKKLLKDRTGSSASRITNDLEKEVTEAESEKLLLACQNDSELRDRIKPYYHFLRSDSWGNPMLYLKDAFMVATGTERRETGTHYTPKSLTEAIVKETLEPVAHIGPAEGKAREEWQLKSPAELLELKICDPAMGSGAFLVQVIRWLSERLCESWLIAEEAGKAITTEGEVIDALDEKEPLPKDAEERLVTARRLIAERCIYGVDVNPLAVELAKLAIWLVTLSKGRPFGFLDHNLRSGNSLLGIHNLDQLYYLNMQPEGMAAGGGAGKQLFTQGIEEVVKEAMKLRKELRERPVRDIRDVRVMAHLNNEAKALVENAELIADALIGEALVSAANPNSLNAGLIRLSVAASAVLDDKAGARATLQHKVETLLVTDVEDKKPHNPFHWALEFPEVFKPASAGFDAIVGNVPFLGGQRITGAMGTSFRNYLITFVAEGQKGSADLAAYFFRQIYRLMTEGGSFGLLATNTIAEGDTRQVGLEPMLSNHGAKIFSAYPNENWPGKAAVATSRIHIRKGAWSGLVKLNGAIVPQISAFLSDHEEWTPRRLAANAGKCFIGSLVHGMGFVLTESEALKLIEQDPKNSEVLFPYLNGKDLNTDPQQRASRWVINFWDWTEEKAQSYLEPYKIVLEKVKPERRMLKTNGKYKLRKPLPQRWWQYAEKRPGFYHAIGRGRVFSSHPLTWDPLMKELDRVLVVSRKAKYFSPYLITNDVVFADNNAVFVTNSYRDLALLNSSILQVWIWTHSARLEMRLSFSPTDAFETLPLPCPKENQTLEQLGTKFDALRIELGRINELGATKLNNLYHNIEHSDAGFSDLRSIAKQIDETIAIEYGWHDLELDHGFHKVGYLPENDCVRYTISEKARGEVLDRLTLLNKERYAQEQSKSSNHVTSKSRKSSKDKAGSDKDDNSQSELFG